MAYTNVEYEDMVLILGKYLFIYISLLVYETNLNGIGTEIGCNFI
jgi:hypothetical protein